MTQIGSIEASHEIQDRGGRGARAALAVTCGALGIAAAVWAYWLVAPGAVLGIVAMVLGAWCRRRGAREAGTIAVVLGAVAMALVPSVLLVVAEAEDWGRECALDPTNPDC